MCCLSEIRLSDVEISVRGGNVLRSRFGDVDLQTIADMGDAELRALPGFTLKCLREVREVIANVSRATPPTGMPANFPSHTFAAALAATIHPQMEPESVAFWERHIARALNQIGWEVQPKATDGQTSDNQ